MKLITALLLFVLFLFSSVGYAETESTRLRIEKETMVKWVMLNSHDKITSAKAKKIVEYAYDYSAKNNVDVLFVLSVLKIESGFREKVKSVYGAKGIMQVYPPAHKDKLKGRNPYDLQVSLEVGTLVLRECMDRFHNDLYKTSNCYSGGGGKKYYNAVTSFKKEIDRSIVLALFEAEENLSN